MSQEKLKTIAEEVISASQSFTDVVGKALQDAYLLGREEAKQDEHES